LTIIISTNNKNNAVEIYNHSSPSEVNRDQSAGFIRRDRVSISMKTNEITYINSQTDGRIISYFIGENVLWTRILNERPQMPYRRNSIDEFKQIVKNEGYDSDESTLVR
jgi:hypothetical protein